ncbi:MAG: ATP-binding protein [Campylobacterota bacterium]|nr:ATP-binding protein [Campylobacterota bacterium]
MFEKSKISSLSKIGFILLGILSVLSTIVLLVFLFILNDLNKDIKLLGDTHNSFLKVKNHTGKLLTSSYLLESSQQWEDSILTFKNKIKNRKQSIHGWYICEKEINSIRAIIKDDFFIKKLKNKPTLQVLGEAYKEENKTKFYLQLQEFIDSVEFLLQNEEFVIKSFDDEYEIKTNLQDEYIKNINLFSIVSTVIFLSLLFMISIYIINHVIRKERELFDNQNKLKKSIVDINESKLFINNLLDIAPLRIFWKDKNGIYLGANKQFLLDAKLDTQDEILGKSDFDMVWKDSANLYVEDDKDVMVNNKAKVRYEEEQISVDGRVSYLITSKVPILDSDNKVIGILGMYDDITSQKLLEKELKENKMIIEQQSKMAAMGEMLENIAHQWRQPLSVITTAASGIQIEREYGISTKENEDSLLTQINNSANHLSKTIDDFRNFFKSNNSKNKFFIKDVLDKTINLISSKIDNRDIKLIYSIENIEINTYEGELIQVFMNIINNAIDALESSINEKKYLFIEIEKDEKNIYIIIKDNAGGVPENIKDKIFEPYFTTKHKRQGTGIGLYMSSQMINEHMKGNLTVSNKSYKYENVKYKGASFKIQLPIDDN